MKPATCRCGHTADAHEHYTVPGDLRCGLCDCPRWHRRRLNITLPWSRDGG